MITKEKFGARLSELRRGGQITARETSLALGQDPSYINRIENNKTFPSMQGFFSICDYLDITPAEFFDEEVACPSEVHAVEELLEKLSQDQLLLIKQVAEQFLSGNNMKESNNSYVDERNL